MTRYVRRSAMAMLLSLVTVLCVVADDKPDKTAPVPKPKEDMALTVESLGVLLENMGLEPTPNMDKEGAVVSYSAKRSITGYNIMINYSLSPNKKWLYLTCNLVSLPDPKIPVKTALALLEANDRWAPVSFYYSEKNNQFIAHLPIYNQGIKAGIVNQMTEYMGKAIEATAVHWDPKKWETEKKAEPK